MEGMLIAQTVVEGTRLRLHWEHLSTCILERRVARPFLVVKTDLG